MKQSNTGRISSRPRIISQLKSRHNGSDICEKLVDGFKVVPIAGPIFDRQEMVAVTESLRSSPRIEAMIDDMTRKPIYDTI